MARDAGLFDASFLSSLSGTARSGDGRGGVLVSGSVAPAAAGGGAELAGSAVLKAAAAFAAQVAVRVAQAILLTAGTDAGDVAA